jgi:hypothetical protein
MDSLLIFLFWIFLIGFGFIFVIAVVAGVRAGKTAEQAAQEQEQAAHQAAVQLIGSRPDVVAKFYEIAERKVSIIDDYGDENWEALPKEIEQCLAKLHGGILDKSALVSYQLAPLRAELERRFRQFHDERKGSKPDIDLSQLTGVEFETYVARLLKDSGFEVAGTPTTGDQGCDLVAKRNGRTVIVQAKRWQGMVGNKAVQEVVAAVRYYGGHEGWVVTNSNFTPAAKALAQRNNVRLIDGQELSEWAVYAGSNVDSGSSELVADVVPCRHCGTQNRVPSVRQYGSPHKFRCGKCKNSLSATV